MFVCLLQVPFVKYAMANVPGSHCAKAIFPPCSDCLRLPYERQRASCTIIKQPYPFFSGYGCSDSKAQVGDVRAVVGGDSLRDLRGGGPKLVRRKNIVDLDLRFF